MLLIYKNNIQYIIYIIHALWSVGFITNLINNAAHKKVNLSKPIFFFGPNEYRF